MRVLGNIDSKVAKKLVAFGCNDSLKDIEGQAFKVIGAVVDTTPKKAEDGTEYTTNYMLIEIDGVQKAVKFTQTIVESQLDTIFDNELEDDLYTVEYVTSSSGNRYLSICPTF